MEKLTIEYLPVDDLVMYENNPRRNEGAVDGVANSIEDFDFNVPIVINKQNVILSGHTRLLAAKKLGLTEVPCVRKTKLTKAKQDAYRLADNKTAEMAEWDEELLAEELERLESEGEEMDRYGFDQLLAEPDSGEIVEDDFEPELPEEPNTQIGDLYKLGDHILMCGDSTSEDALLKLMGGSRANMVFTDPPYGVAIGSKNKTLNKMRGTNSIDEDIIGDNIPIEELRDILRNAFANLKKNGAAEDCAYYITAPNGGDVGLMMQEMMKDAGLPIRHILIWVKNAATFSMCRLDYDYRHEPIFYTWADKHNFYGRSKNTVIDDSIPLDEMSRSELIEMVEKMRDSTPESVIYENKPTASKLHPTMKPVRLVARLIENSSQQGDIVADIFGGSGTTIIACEQLGRKCRMMELDPHYCDVIVDRWEQFTGKTAEKIG